MSQFPGNYHEPHAATYPQKTSGMAITALVLSLILCCPITTLIGTLLGIFAFISIGSDPTKKGRGMALAAIIIGVIATGGWIWLGYQWYSAFVLMRDAPRDAIRAGYDANYAQMSNAFSGVRVASDDEAQAFVDELRARYGNVVQSEMGFQGFDQVSGAMTFRYKLVFDQDTVEADVVFDPQSQTGGDEIIFESITIYDSARGDLTFPPRTAAGGSARPGSRSAPPPPEPTESEPVPEPEPADDEPGADDQSQPQTDAGDE